VAVQADWSASEHLSVFIDDLIDWTEEIGELHLERPDLNRLQQATAEIRATQVPALQAELREVDRTKFETAGFTESQAIFKTATARNAMARAANPPFYKRWSRKSVVEGVGVALEAVKEVLGSIASLSKWIEAAAELVGIVGSGVKAAAPRLERWFGRRSDAKDEEEEEEAGPAVAR
jgi:hypothetical protein